jgi:aspartyl-tRNA synthetase
MGEGGLDSLAEDDVRSPVARYFSVEEVRHMALRAGARRGDLLLLVADQPRVANRALDGLRRYLARRLGLADPKTFSFCFVVDFPLLEWDEEDGRWYSVNHPFTAPKAEDLPLLESDPGRVRARAYDLVCNGWELGGGSIRIHDRELQERVFRLLGLGPEEARASFGHMLEAFEFGAPPHGGIALGFDRVVALFCDEDDIREVMAFPKTKSATEPMTGAPGPVTDEQLRELHLRIREE